MGWRLARLVAGAAAYGLSIGLVHSPRFAVLNLAKFPLLLLITSAVCALAYHVIARFFATRLEFADVMRLVITSFADAATLLASLAGVCLLLALTMKQPLSRTVLGDYPAFLAMNVLFVALCGSASVWRQGRRMLLRHAVPLGRVVPVIGGWLLVSLVVGGQCAWYLRPFVGVRTVVDQGGFCLGTAPDFRGATSFFEAVGHVASPPDASRRLQEGTSGSSRSPDRRASCNASSTRCR